MQNGITPTDFFSFLEERLEAIMNWTQDDKIEFISDFSLDNLGCAW